MILFQLCQSVPALADFIFNFELNKIFLADKENTRSKMFSWIIFENDTNDKNVVGFNSLII